jgi:hypothetical protein
MSGITRRHVARTLHASLNLGLVVSALVSVTGCVTAQRPSAAEDSLAHDMAAETQSQDSTRAALREELPQREAQWTSHAISAYRLAIRVRYDERSAPLAVVTVRGDSTLVQNALAQPLSGYWTESLAFTVPKLFDEVRRAVADTSYFIYVRFDPTYGFPTVIQMNDRDTWHTGYNAVVEAFEVLPRTSP